MNIGELERRLKGICLQLIAESASRTPSFGSTFILFILE